MLNKEAQDNPTQQTAQSMPTPSMNETQIEVVAKKKKLRKLSLKQREFISKYLKNQGNGQKTALEVYNTTDENTARVIASENLTKPNIISAMEEAYTKTGLTKDKFGEIIGKKVLNTNEKLAPKDHAKYCGMYIETVPGVKAPSRQESHTDNTYNINLSMVQSITLEVRKAIQNALQDTNSIKPIPDYT